MNPSSMAEPADRSGGMSAHKRTSARERNHVRFAFVSRNSMTRYPPANFIVKNRSLRAKLENRRHQHFFHRQTE